MGALRYYICTAVMVAAIAGFYLGGNYVWLGVGTFPVLMFLDLFLPQDHRDYGVKEGVSGFIADFPLFLHTFLMIAMYALFVRWFVTMGGPFNAAGEWSWAQTLGAFLSIAWVSAVPTLPISHELMHRTHWFPRFCNKILNTFYMDTNRDIGHIITHHIHLNTPADADTPYRGQLLYPFLWQATKGSYVDAVEGEANRLRNRGKSPWHPSNKTYMQILLLIGFPLGIGLAAGTWVAGVITLAAMFLAKMIVEAFNYHQHYGLIRVPGEPVKIYHAWNHLGPIVRPIGVEITNHINHHEDSYIPFYALKPHPEGACMPSIFVCFIFGLIPPLWFHFLAKPKLKYWDNNFASPEEQKLAMQANARAGWPMWIEAPQAAAQAAPQMVAAE